MEEICFQFIQYRYRHLGYLHPILDYIMWPEEVEKIPISGWVDPNHFRILFATKDYYYIYAPEDDLMYKAGRTLEEVFEGPQWGKDSRGEIVWECMERPAWCGKFGAFFPTWSDDGHPGRRRLQEEIEPFVPPLDEM
jgi:hypothetical protein